MIPIVEDYLSELLESKLAYLKANPSQLDSILKTSQLRLDRLKEYIQAKPIEVTIGYPRPTAKLPTLAIVLGNEDEEQVGLGDQTEEDDVDIREVTSEVTAVDTRGGRLAVPYVELPNKPVVSITQILHVGLGIMLSQSEYILQNTDGGLVGFYSANVEEGDVLQVTYTYQKTGQTNVETLYNSNYRVEIWAENGDIAVQLYNLAKWALLTGRGDLVQKGLIRQTLGGTDFFPSLEYMPTFVYRRALSFSCYYVTSAMDGTYEYISGVDVNESTTFDIGGN